MNAQQLWNDHTFHLLLADVFKVRKDATMGPIRLKILLDYVGTPTEGNKGAERLVEAPKAIAETETEAVEPEDKGVPLIPKDLKPFETREEKYQRMEELLIDKLKGKAGLFTLALPIDFDTEYVPFILEKYRLPYVMTEGAMPIAGHGNRAPGHYATDGTDRAGDPEVQAMMDAKIREQFGQWAVDDGGDKWLVKFAPKQ